MDELPKKFRTALVRLCEKRAKEGAIQAEILRDLQLCFDAADLGLDTPHRFGGELNTLVFINHRLTLEGLSRWEKNDKASFKDLDRNARRDAMARSEVYYDEVRSAANNLALVGLITRFHHWVSKLVESLAAKSARDRSLAKNLRTLNEHLGAGPVPLSFFADLVTARDSIVHADSQGEWTFRGKQRQVAMRYRDLLSGELYFSDDDLQEAIENSVRQVKWYDDKLQDWRN
jgi:hypothetical protein